MDNRILVTYATRAGSTAEVAAASAETLAARGYAVDVKPVKEKTQLTGYSAVVLGSAIRMGDWLPEADHRDWDEIRQWANAVEV